MDDKSYVSSMLTAVTAFMHVNIVISVKESKDEQSKRFSFCRKVAGTGKIEPALLGVLKAAYYLMTANGMKPEDYEEGLKLLMPSEVFNNMKIGNHNERYRINSAMRINGALSFLKSKKLLNKNSIEKIKDAEIRNAIDTITGQEKTFAKLSKFEDKYVRLKSGFDKPDSPFLLVKRFSEILQENPEAVEKGEKIDLGKGRYIRKKVIGKKTYRIIRHADSTFSVVDEKGNSKNVKDEKKAEELASKLAMSDGLKKSVADKKENVKTEEKKDEEKSSAGRCRANYRAQRSAEPRGQGR